MLAMQAGLPLVPISVVGSRHVMKKGELTTQAGPRHGDRARADRDRRPWRSRRCAEVRALADRVREVIRPAVEAEAAARPEPNLAI